MCRDKKQGGAHMEVPEWEDFEDVSGYQKFSIPYGPGYHAKKYVPENVPRSSMLTI